MDTGETEGLVPTTLPPLPGSVQTPLAKDAAKAYEVPESGGDPQIVLSDNDRQPTTSNWMTDQPGAEQTQNVWLSSTKPSEEWCPVGRTLGDASCMDAPFKIVGCSIDAHTALVATSDGTVRLWHLQTGSCIKTLENPDSSNADSTRDCCLFHSGKKAVSCGLGVRVWDVATGQMRVLPEYSDAVKCCDASLDGTKVLFGSTDGTLNIWHLDSAKDNSVDTYTGHTGEVNGCRFFDSARKALSCSIDKTVRAWTLGDPDGNLALVGHGDTVLDCDVCPGGKRAVSCSGDRTVKLWNITPTKHEKEMVAELRGAASETRAKELKQKLNIAGTRRCLKTLTLTHGKPTACRVFPDGVRVLIITDNPEIYSLDTSHCMQILRGHQCTINTCSLYDEGTKAVTCGKQMRVWDLSSRGKPHQLGLPDHSDMHTSVVKELRVSPDGRRILSCAYDDSLRIWDLETGNTIETFGGENTHDGQVFDCSWFPDQEQVLSCGRDKTLKIWSTRSGDLVKTLKGHTKKVRGCWVFDDGKQVLSCSEDCNLMVWDVASGQPTKTLSGHEDLVDRCSVFVKGGVSYGMSASWDCTLMLWDLNTGKSLGVMRDHNKARGFTLYKDNTRAVSTGSGLRLSIWNIDDVTNPTLLSSLETGHTKTVWGIELLCDTLTNVVRCLTFSQDGTLRVWNLTEGEEREEVSGRRAFEPGPMCAAAIPSLGNYALGNAPVVVGLGKNEATGLGDIKLVDLSNLGSGPSSSALALALKCVSVDTWTQWLLDAMDEDEKANVLFLRDEKSEFPTLVHKLAERPDGADVLREICKKYQDESALGLVSHAGPSPSGNALEVAITHQHEDVAKVLLDDYSRHVEEATYDLTGDHLLTVNAAVRLFEAFPGVATQFLATVELCKRSGLVQQGSRCDFGSSRYAELVRDHAFSSPVPADDGILWWDKKLDKLWKQSHTSNAATRADDTAYGERAEAKMLPFVCARAIAGAADGDQHLPFSRLLEKASCHADEHGPAIFESAVLRIIVQLKWEGACKFMHMTQFYAYCIFLAAYICCTLLYATAVKTDDRVYMAIVWATGGYSLFYAILLAKREIHQIVAAWQGEDSNNICVRGWATLKRYFELWNVMDLVNIVFTLWSLAMMVYGVRWDGSVRDGKLYESVDFHTVRCLQALAGFGAGFKILYFLRGMDFASFLINMLEHIIYDMIDFLVVLMVIIVMYMYVFHLLLNGPQGPTLDDPLPESGDDGMGFPLEPMSFEHEPYNMSDVRTTLSFEEGFMSFIAVHNMMYGDFDMAHFDNYHGRNSWVLTLCMFVVFMLIVPTIMFNSLIAIMGDTYGRVNDQKEAAGLHERAKLILELENGMVYENDAEGSGTPFKRMSLLKRIAFTLMSRTITYSTHNPYIHVLVQEKVELEEEDVALKRIAKLDEQMQKMQEHISEVDTKLSDQTEIMLQILARLPEQTE